VRVPKYVSGSIPSACISGPAVDDDDDENTLDTSCSYPDVQFVGGDLSSVSADSLDGCRQLCVQEPDCQVFTYYPQEERNCFLKSESAQAKMSTDVISGSVDEDCKDVILPDIDLTYNKNEINGRFKMDMTFREEYRDPNSVEYQKLSGDVEKYLRDMLENEPEFGEQAVFDVRVVSFTPGSVVCNFKVNYVLREAYLAIPFAIKPTNITTAMNKNFKFRRGIIFQKFIIVAGSFKSSTPVDHCSAKGCSHKCDYDYSVEDYVCTCPPGLVLDLDEKTCVEPDQVGETTTYQPSVKVTLLPSDCLWSAWSVWSSCNCDNSQSDRKRTIVTPAKNGGVCSGRYKEVKDCDCNGDQDTTVAPAEKTDSPAEISGNEDENTENVDYDTTIGSVTFGDKEILPTETPILTTESVLMDDVDEVSTENEIEIETDSPLEASTQLAADVTGEETTEVSKQEKEVDSDEVTTVEAIIDGITTVQTTLDEVTSAEASLDELTTMKAAIDEVTTMEASLDEVSTMEAAIDELTTMEAAIDDVTTTKASLDEVSDMEAAIDELTTMKATLDESTSMEETIDEVTTLEAALYEVTTIKAVIDELTTMEATMDDSTSMNATLDESTSMDALLDEVTTMEATQDEVTTEEATLDDDVYEYDDATFKPDETATTVKGEETTDLPDISGNEEGEGTTVIPDVGSEGETVDVVTENIIEVTTDSEIEVATEIILEDVTDSKILENAEDSIDEEESTTESPKTIEETVDGADVEDIEDEKVTENSMSATEESLEGETTTIGLDTVTELQEAIDNGDDSMETTTLRDEVTGSDDETEVETEDPIQTDSESSTVLDMQVTTDTSVDMAEVKQEGVTESAILDDDIDEEYAEETDLSASEDQEVTTESGVEEEKDVDTEIVDDVAKSATEVYDEDVTDISETDDTASSTVKSDNELENEDTDTDSMKETTVSPAGNDQENIDEEMTTIKNEDGTESDISSTTGTPQVIKEEQDDAIVFPDGTESTSDEPTTVSILEFTEPSVNDIPSLSQTNDEKTDVVDTNMITDTPRSFPDTSAMGNMGEEEVITTTVGYVDPAGTTAGLDVNNSESTTVLETEEESISTTINPTADKPVATTLAPTGDESVDSTDAPAVDEPVDTKQAQSGDESISTTVAPNGEESVDTTLAPTGEESGESDPAQTDNESASTTLAPTDEAVVTTQASTGDSTLAPAGDESISTTLVPSDEEGDETMMTTAADDSMAQADSGVSTIDDSAATTVNSPMSESDSTTIIPDAMVKVVSVEEDEETTVMITTTDSSQVTAADDIDGDSDVTTEPPMDVGEHEFDCEELDEGDLNTTSEQIPMRCTQLDGTKRRRVFLVISKSQVSAETLFAKNVKVVVKDLMVMSITPDSSSRR
jgi:hypothetical protein